LTENEWDALLRKTNFTGTKASLWDMSDLESHHSSTIISTAALEPVSCLSEVIILTESSLPDPCADQLTRLLSSIGVASKLADITEHDLNNKLCIVLSSRTRCILRNPTTSQYDAIKRIFLKSAGVLWVNHGAQIESSAPDLNLVTGLARTIKAEKGDTMIVTLDLDAGSSPSDRPEAETIFTVLNTNFGTNMGILEIDTEYAERDGVLMIPRVIEDHTLTSFVMSSTGHPTAKEEVYHQEGRHLRAEIKTPGLLDSLQFVDDVRISGDIPHDFVQIEVKASGVNFRDVMSASGQIEPYPLGCECAGVITAVGISVQGFRPGDHVIANARGGTICTTIRASTNEIEHIPEDLPFHIAASLPIIYFTAYYAVFKVARLTKGETILVHAASGGLGQAIINLALLVGAEIYATVGTLEKKRLLMAEFHIREDHIFSSRDRTFATGIMRRTCGKGVDVVMNSLSGDALRLTWDCIAAFGRFVELGKRDMTVNMRLEMRHFEKNVAFTGLDVPLHTHFEEKRRTWTELMAWYAEGRIHAPRPITTFGIAETETALRTMQAGRHMGKLVLVPRPGETVRVVRRDDAGGDFLRGEDASYLLIGGLGGIGRAIALYMIEHGARNLIFASRSGATSEKARDCVAQLKARGANVAVFACDVSESADVDRVLEECARTMPPIRGLIHAAMVPTVSLPISFCSPAILTKAQADLFENMTLDDYNAAMRPKVDGIWNLHNRLSRTDVDFFIMLSSVVGLVGNPSQAAYVAASLFLDAFADFRNQLGLPAVSLDLGRVVGVGFVAENDAASRGVSKLWSRDIDEAELMALIASAMVAPRRADGRPGASITGRKRWAPAAGTALAPPMFSHFRRAAMRKEAAGAEGGLAGRVLGSRVRAVLREATSPDEAARYVCDAVMEKMAALLMVPTSDISASRSMADYGMDSLVAVEMRNWLAREMDATVPILDLLANVSVQELSAKIVLRSKIVNPAILAGKEM
jgi:NADPH:quinone reductase-like Zn-dependent oxidoreductase/NAD(P)-dependent dehydrogenase (short-subunit alcohol dehydrogenase family)